MRTDSKGQFYFQTRSSSASKATWSVAAARAPPTDARIARGRSRDSGLNPLPLAVEDFQLSDVFF